MNKLWSPLLVSADKYGKLRGQKSHTTFRDTERPFGPWPGSRALGSCFLWCRQRLDANGCESIPTCRKVPWNSNLAGAGEKVTEEWSHRLLRALVPSTASVISSLPISRHLEGFFPVRILEHLHYTQTSPALSIRWKGLLEYIDESILEIQSARVKNVNNVFICFNSADHGPATGVICWSTHIKCGGSISEAIVWSWVLLRPLPIKGLDQE